ncbi:hypothetical protein B0T10DRAFT_221688 [Thelonectria olida]|uniref:Uncharacterized protein n=1 Tax=Thelonectria olida TaxID=1576542 RepID=A0A9P9AWB1_9HYPO|nr:hypothetical protein B0T10DRAFT_221688 [Thelonectria olida]
MKTSQYEPMALHALFSKTCLIVDSEPAAIQVPNSTLLMTGGYGLNYLDSGLWTLKRQWRSNNVSHVSGIWVLSLETGGFSPSPASCFLSAIEEETTSFPECPLSRRKRSRCSHSQFADVVFIILSDSNPCWPPTFPTVQPVWLPSVACREGGRFTAEKRREHDQTGFEIARRCRERESSPPTQATQASRLGLCNSECECECGSRFELSFSLGTKAGHMSDS